jgi:hypothetical protein
MNNNNNNNNNNLILCDFAFTIQQAYLLIVAEGIWKMVWLRRREEE